MPKVYSQDLREKAIAAIERGVPKSEVVTMFNIYKLHSPSKARVIAPYLKPGSKPAEFRNFNPIKS